MANLRKRLNIRHIAQIVRAGQIYRRHCILLQKLKIGTLGLLSVGLLAACNTTEEYEQDPDMGPPSATEEPADEDVEDLPTDGDDVEEDAS